MPRSNAEPRAASLYFIPRSLSGLQAKLVDSLRGYFSHAPGWVLLTTVGRRTGMLREVLLPCARTESEVVVISTYGWRSNWIRNLRNNHKVKVTHLGAEVRGTAEVIEDIDEKHRIVSEHPFVPLAPFKVVHLVALTILRPLTVAGLKRWVTPRPLVVIRTEVPPVRALFR